MKCKLENIFLSHFFYLFIIVIFITIDNKGVVSVKVTEKSKDTISNSSSNKIENTSKLEIKNNNNNKEKQDFYGSNMIFPSYANGISNSPVGYGMQSAQALPMIPGDPCPCASNFPSCCTPEFETVCKYIFYYNSLVFL